MYNTENRTGVLLGQLHLLAFAVPLERRTESLPVLLPFFRSAEVRCTLVKAPYILAVARYLKKLATQNSSLPASNPSSSYPPPPSRDRSILWRHEWCRGVFPGGPRRVGIGGSSSLGSRAGLPQYPLCGRLSLTWGVSETAHVLIYELKRNNINMHVYDYCICRYLDDF